MYPASMSRATPSPGRLTVTEACVLGLLVAKEQSGYDLNRSAQQSVGLIYAPAKSRIYAVLPRLLKRGLVTRRDGARVDRPDPRTHPRPIRDATSRRDLARSDANRPRRLTSESAARL